MERTDEEWIEALYTNCQRCGSDHTGYRTDRMRSFLHMYCCECLHVIISDQDPAVALKNDWIKSLDLMKASLHALNAIPNTDINHEKYRDSYALAAELSKHLEHLEPK